MAAVNLPPLTFTFGPYRLDHETGQLHHADRIVSLQPRPLAVLRAFLEAGGSLVTKEDLIERVWDGAFIGYVMAHLLKTATSPNASPKSGSLCVRDSVAPIR